MTHGSLFSGIGGFDLAAEWMGWENKFHCEWNEFGQKVLKYYWPNAELFSDITKSDFTKYANKIDVLTGGFPCQPYSTAGKRLGKEDERHLWPEMLRAIREIKPRWVVGENVLGLVSWNGGLVFEEVQTDLEAEGYEVQPYVLPACGVNAPHKRDRVWFVAYSRHKATGQAGDSDGNAGEKSATIHTKGQGGDSKAIFYNGLCDLHRPSPHTNHTGGGYGLGQVQGENGEISEWNNNAEFGNTSDGYASDTSNTELQRSEFNRGIEEKRKIQREGRQFSGSIRNKWEDFPSVSPICDGNDGISDRLDGITFSKWRNESIKAGGNAIVPQVVLQIFKAIQQYEDSIVHENA